MKAIEITAVLDDADRIVPQSPLPEHPAENFELFSFWMMLPPSFPLPGHPFSRSLRTLLS
jgi:hypothetical protein